MYAVFALTLLAVSLARWVKSRLDYNAACVRVRSNLSRPSL